MKIVQALGWYRPESLGGTEVYVEGLCRRLDAAGHEVFVASPDPAHDYERTYCHDAIPVYRYPISRNLSRAEYQGMLPVPGTERFHAWLAKKRPDVVHVHSFVTGLGLSELKAAKAVGARVIVTSHESSLGYICQRGTMMRWGKCLCDGVCRPAKCAACALQERGLPKPVAWMVGSISPRMGRVALRLPGKLGTALGMSDYIARRQAMQREIFTTVDKFVLLTRWALEAVVANGAPREKVALNRLGLSQNCVVRKPGPECRPTELPITVGYIGRFDPIKGVLDLGRAIASLPRHVPIRVAFRGPVNSDKAKGMIDQLQALVGDDPRVIFAPEVPAEKVPSVLASYDALCCPAVCLEGGPTVAIEAHAVGIPVIGTRIGGLAEIVTDGINGKLVPPGDWTALAQALRDMACDPAGTIDRWRQALPRARTMDEIAKDYLELYDGRL